MEDVIRVMRIIEYVGPREVVEEQVRRSVQGEILLDKQGRRTGGGILTIRATTLGAFPEILNIENEPRGSYHHGVESILSNQEQDDA